MKALLFRIAWRITFITTISYLTIVLRTAIFPPKDGAKGERQRVEGSLKTYSKEPIFRISVS
jgi:hypothetical protein